MEEPTRIILIRHGQTLWNTQTRIQGHTDIGLDALGRWQARQLGQALAHEPISAVYASNLSRARDTAQALATALNLSVAIDDGLRERGFGRFEGSTFAEIEARWPDQAERWRRRDPDFGPPGGEVLSEFFDRCVQAVHAIASRHEGATVAMVTHGGVLDCLYRAATGQNLQAPRTWAIANAGINRLMRADQRLMLIGWADVAHLQEPSLDEVRESGA